MLNEYVMSNHWTQRVGDRAVNIDEIIYPNAIFEGVEDKEALRAALDERLKKIVRARILAFQVLQDADPSKYVCTVIVSLQLRKGGQMYTPMLKAARCEGNTYVGVTNKNTLITLLVIPKEQIDPHSLTQRCVHHMKGQGVVISESEIDIKVASNVQAVLDVDSTILQMNAGSEAPMGVPKVATDLPYKVKKDYLKSTKGRPNFITHNQFGRGEIIQSEQGMGGKWSNVVVKFPTGNKTFKTLYADSFF